VGKELLEMLILNCGLPEEYARRRLYTLIADAGIKPEDVTIEDVREALSSLLQEIILEA
jgi:hypothetical protein